MQWIKMRERAKEAYDGFFRLLELYGLVQQSYMFLLVFRNESLEEARPSTKIHTKAFKRNVTTN